MFLIFLFLDLEMTPSQFCENTFSQQQVTLSKILFYTIQTWMTRERRTKQYIDKLRLWQNQVLLDRLTV